MNIEIPYFKDLPPPLQQAILITCGSLIICSALIFFAILPVRTRLQVIRTEIADLNGTFASMEKDIAETAQQQAKTTASMLDVDAFIASGVIEPLLGSFAMRGKSLIDPLAQKTGFTISGAKELPFIPLRAPSPAPEQLFGRQPIEFTGQGSYAQITALISLTEESLPLATLSSLVILSQPQTPEIHRAIITFEWPTKGEKRSLP